jgi:hypothetical protein
MSLSGMAPGQGESLKSLVVADVQERQKALDAVRPDPGPAAEAADLDEVFARLGLR